MTDEFAWVRSRLGDAFESPVTGLTELDGGMVGTVFRATFDGREPVVAKVGPTPLDVEARMLRYLARHSSLPVPSVLAADSSLLVLELVAGDTDHDDRVAADAAAHLAGLHSRTAGAFGFPFDTLSGPLRQPNPWTASWIEFFRSRRLGHVVDLMAEASTLPESFEARLSRVVDDLDRLLVEPARPALVHGDVWRENVLSQGGRVTAVLDPACYYGHPEVELAYVDWTGTFGEPFFERYRRHRDVATGFVETRRHVYALYPICEHVHLFGERYHGVLDSKLSRLGY